MKILAIETSCDETAVSILDCSGDFIMPKFTILAHVVSSQTKIHEPYGGVVPNLAKREHLQNLPTVLEQALVAAQINKPEEELDVLAVTSGPGLEPALWTGITFATDLAKQWHKPLVAVNHMEGHLLSPLSQDQEINFPVLALLISGGHTELVLSKNWLEYEKLGQTRDDAVGEAFDKVARILNLPYPGGPEISRLAEEAKNQNSNIKLPRPMLNTDNYEFSFSGLKTAVLYLVQKNPEINKAEVAHEFQQAVIDVLLSKTLRAIEAHQPKTVIIAGGVAGNRELQKQFRERLASDFPDINLLIPEQKLTTDNATMIAIASYFHALKNNFVKAGEDIRADGNLSL